MVFVQDEASPRTFSDRLSAFARDDSGATSIEYSMIAALIALVLFLAFQAVGTAVNSSMSDVSAEF